MTSRCAPLSGHAQALLTSCPTRAKQDSPGQSESASAALGLNIPNDFPALKERNKTCGLLKQDSPTIPHIRKENPALFCPFRANPFSGTVPKALPWAILSWRFQRADARPAAAHYQQRETPKLRQEYWIGWLRVFALGKSLALRRRCGSTRHAHQLVAVVVAVAGQHRRDSSLIRVRRSVATWRDGWRTGAEMRRVFAGNHWDCQPAHRRRAVPAAGRPPRHKPRQFSDP